MSVYINGIESRDRYIIEIRSSDPPPEKQASNVLLYIFIAFACLSFLMASTPANSSFWFPVGLVVIIGAAVLVNKFIPCFIY